MRLFIASPVILSHYDVIKNDLCFFIVFFGHPPRILFAKAEDENVSSSSPWDH